MSSRIMVRSPIRAGEVVARRLATLAELTDSELRLIEALGGREDMHAAGSVLNGPRFLVAGWACRRLRLPDGGRQIFSFVLPGEAIPPGPPTGVLGAGYVALTPVRSVDYSKLISLSDDPDQYPAIAAALRKLQDAPEQHLLDQIVRLGKRTAYQRLGHILLDFRERLAAVGLAEPARMPMPVTQEALSDALGLSIVHLNRTLQQLRRDGLIELRGGVAAFPDLERLADLCGYEAPRRHRAEARPRAELAPGAALALASHP